MFKDITGFIVENLKNKKDAHKVLNDYLKFKGLENSSIGFIVYSDNLSLENGLMHFRIGFDITNNALALDRVIDHYKFLGYYDKKGKIRNLKIEL